MTTQSDTPRTDAVWNNIHAGASKRRAHAEQLERENARLREALELPLTFHSGSPWDAVKERRWLEITGSEEVTTKVMCDTIRAALRQP